jgi:pimeloyl-ACP methyl ester carboxylesterase
MPAFLVHGVPDTHRLWDRLRAHLGRRDVIAPSLPGFGVPVPPGFAATKEAYAAWLIAELERVGEPVDLVAHDWGAILAQHVVGVRPDLIRTWALGDGVVDVEYVWHPMAQQWQTPGVGEQAMAMMEMLRQTGGPELAEALAGGGMPIEGARDAAPFIDERMQQCILALYRSATNVGVEWQPDVERIARPGLVLWSADDPFVDARFARRLADRTGARLVLFEGAGHWWPVSRPVEAAAALEELWAQAS